MVGKGIVVKTDGEYAIVRIKKTTSCSGSCSDCGACTAPEFETAVLNPVGAKAGDTVLIGAGARAILVPAFMMYVLPLAGSFLIYAALSALKLSAAKNTAAVVLWLAVWLLLLRRYGKKRIETSSITEVINEKD